MSLVTMNLYDLCKSCSNSPSNIVHFQGSKTFSVCFAELHDSVHKLSSILESLELSNSYVCCLINPSISVCTIILGILKSSLPFAILDPNIPKESLLSFQKYVTVKVLLVEKSFLLDFQPKLCSCWKKITEINLFNEFVILKSDCCADCICANSKIDSSGSLLSHFAYAVQTSGSTGVPKVVQVPHACIASNIIDFKSRFSVSSADIILQATRFTFDPSVVEIFLALSTGASLIFIDDITRSVPSKLRTVIAENGITIFQATPSLIKSMGDDFLKNTLLSKDSSLRILALGGEPCPLLSKLQSWKSAENQTEIYNLYGLTEVSCWASCHKIDFTDEKTDTIPLGEPLLNTKFHIHNEDLSSTKNGELFIGGINRFCIVNDEMWPDSSDDFMRPTGDLVYQNSEGQLFFDGRNDSIIKCKGYKLSLQLLNTTIEAFSEVQNHFLYFNPYEEKLYLFVVWRPSILPHAYQIEQDLVNHVRKAIPVLPAVIVFPVPYIPMTEHGKADKRKLVTLLSVKRAYSPETYKQVLESSWKNYVGNITIEESANLVLRGCDSVSAVQLASDLEWKLQVSLPLLVEKLLNETYKDVLRYISSVIERSKEEQSNFGNTCLFPSYEAKSLTKKESFTSKCFRLSCKQGYFEKCCCLQHCFPVKDQISSIKSEFVLTMEVKSDLRKCIDATPCVLYSRDFGYLVLIGSHYGQFCCISIEKKMELWSIFLPDRIESSACVSACGNFVLFGCYDHYIYCVCILDGLIHWKVQTQAEVKSSPSISADNVAFVGSHDKCLYAISVQDGVVLWKRQIASGSIFSSPLIIEKLNSVCVATLDGVIALLTMKSGDIVWQYNSKAALFSTPLLAYDSIFIGSTSNALMSINLEGELLHQFSTSKPIFSSAASTKDPSRKLLVFGCHDSFVYCITDSAQLVWKNLCDSPIYGTPFIFKQTEFYVCVASSKGTLYILDLNDGKVVFSQILPGEIFSGPIVFDNFLVVGCRDNNVYCFNLGDSSYDFTSNHRSSVK